MSDTSDKLHITLCWAGAEQEVVNGYMFVLRKQVGQEEEDATHTWHAWHDDASISRARCSLNWLCNVKCEGDGNIKHLSVSPGCKARLLNRWSQYSCHIHVTRVGNQKRAASLQYSCNRRLPHSKGWKMSRGNQHFCSCGVNTCFTRFHLLFPQHWRRKNKLTSYK